MRTVNRFESDLLRILQCWLGKVPAAHVLPLMARETPPPGCLGRDAVALVEDMLAKGCTWRLIQAGGWQREPFLRDGQAVDGRLWERTLPKSLGLKFSAYTMKLLIWATAKNIAESRPPSRKNETITLADRLLWTFAQTALHETRLADWCRFEPIASDGLTALMFPDDFAKQPGSIKPDFSPWMTEQGMAIIEAMQNTLAMRWVQIERSKSIYFESDAMRALGQMQERLLNAYCDAIDRHGRRDLARFLLIAIERLLHGNPTSDRWCGKINVRNLRMADRTATYQAAFAMLRQIERLERWQREARNVRFHDENYDASQLWKADWERFDADSRCQVAHAIVRRADPLSSERPMARE